MRIQDAEAGDVLADRDLAIWLRGENGARCLYDPDFDCGGDLDAPGGMSLPLEAVEKFGPFTRLVPEKEAP